MRLNFDTYARMQLCLCVALSTLRVVARGHALKGTANQQQQLANMYDHIDRFGTAYFNNDVLEMLTGEVSTSYHDFARELANTTQPSLS